MNLRRYRSSILKYWQTTLSDEDRKSLRYDRGLYLDLAEIVAGQLSAGCVAHLADIWKVHLSYRTRRARQPRDSISVVFGLLSLTPREHGNACYTKTALWVPALLNEDGTLHPYRDKLPWLSRGVLEPSADAGATVSSVDEYDAFLRAHPLDLPNWPAVIAYVRALCVELLDQDLAHVEVYDHQVGQPFVQVYPDEPISAQPIIRLQDALMAQDDSTAGATALWSFWNDSTQSRRLGPIDERAHLGQMEGRYPLSASQRLALHAHLSCKQGDIQAITGPPGTGKTTLIQSIVANSVVEAALTGQMPRIILACSTNNQAILNVRESFAKVAVPPGHFLERSLLVRRWLPEVQSYCLYLPAKHRVDLHDPSYARPENGTWDGLPAKLDDAAYTARAESHYLEQYAQWKQQPASLSAAVQDLHGLLLHSKQTFDGLLEARERLRAAYELAGGDATLAQRAARLAECNSEIARAGAALSAAIEREDKAKRAYARRANILHACSNAYAPRGVLELLGITQSSRVERLIQAASRQGADIGWAEKDSSAQAAEKWLQAGRDHHEQARAEIAVLSRSAAQSREASRLARERKGKIAGEYALLERAEERWRTESAAFYTYIHPDGENKPDAYDDFSDFIRDLDTGWRLYLFHLASRYWEGRWLLEMRALHTATGPHQRQPKQGESEVLACLRRFSMITPIFVGTFHTVPRYLTYYGSSVRPLIGGVDWLIVDEAGQVAPDVGAASFALAKQATVIGDPSQIEPIWATLPYHDEAAIRAFHLSAVCDELIVRKYRSCGGNVMAMAQSVTAYAYGDQPGVLLTEHRRCFDSIIAFNNELVYGGRLQPLRGDPPADRLPLATLSAVFVGGDSERVGGSLRNMREAQELIDWLEMNRGRILNRYRRRGETVALADIVSIITPFRAQVYALERLLSQRGLGDIEVGTVHAFQGAERPVILFSCVFTPKNAPYSFINAQPNFLNVAVSRAQDSFVYFGDRQVAQAAGPLGMLWKHLLAREVCDASVTAVAS